MRRPACTSITASTTTRPAPLGLTANSSCPWIKLTWRLPRAPARAAGSACAGMCPPSRIRTATVATEHSKSVPLFKEYQQGSRDGWARPPIRRQLAPGGTAPSLCDGRTHLHLTHCLVARRQGAASSDSCTNREYLYGDACRHH